MAFSSHLSYLPGPLASEVILSPIIYSIKGLYPLRFPHPLHTSPLKFQVPLVTDPVPLSMAQRQENHIKQALPHLRVLSSASQATCWSRSHQHLRPQGENWGSCPGSSTHLRPRWSLTPTLIPLPSTARPGASPPQISDTWVPRNEPPLSKSLFFGMEQCWFGTRKLP